MSGDKKAARVAAEEHAVVPSCDATGRGAHDTSAGTRASGAAGAARDAKSYSARIIARAMELRESDAFAPPDSTVENKISAAQAKRFTRAQHRDWRRVTLAFGLAGLLIAAFSLLLPYVGFDAMGVGGSIYTPDQVIDCYNLWFRMNVAPLFDSTLANRTGAMYEEFLLTHPSGMYTLVINRAVATIIVIMCGFMLAVSGLLFQASFRNPLATPSMLGVSDGVTIGCIIFSMTGHSAIADNSTMYVWLVYGFGALAVVGVILLSRGLSGGARYNVLDMLLLGTVVAQLLGGVGSFVQNFIMDEMQWFNFYNVQQAGDAITQPIIQIMAVVVFVITVVPLLF